MPFITLATPRARVAAESPNDKHSANIDILRAIAVLSVVAHHLYALAGFHLFYFGELGGLLGVQLFFIISGYLISESACKYPLPNFALHRFFRIFPAYWVALILVGIPSHALTLEKIADHPGSFLLSLANLQQLYAVALFDLDVLHVTWTLTVEMAWYVLAPLLVIAYRRHALSALVVLITLSTLWSIGGPRHQFDVLYANGLAAMAHPGDPGRYVVLVGAAFPAQLMFFGLGALIYRYKEKALEIRPSVLLLCIFLSLGLLEHYVSLLPSPTIFTGLGLAAFFILMIRVPPLDLPLLVHIGKISYSVYLLHFTIIIWCFHNLGHLGKWHVLIAMAIVFAASHLLYILVERPWIRFARRFR